MDGPMTMTKTCVGGCGVPTGSNWAKGGHDHKLEAQIVKAMGYADDTEGRLALKELVENHMGVKIDCFGFEPEDQTDDGCV